MIQTTITMITTATAMPIISRAGCKQSITAVGTRTRSVSLCLTKGCNSIQNQKQHEDWNWLAAHTAGKRDMSNVVCLHRTRIERRYLGLTVWVSTAESFTMQVRHSDDVSGPPSPPSLPACPLPVCWKAGESECARMCRRERAEVVVWTACAGTEYACASC